ncbi:50S ribosomal protein L10 [Erysipelotrichaceae bacterium HCN-30851]
MNQAIIDSKKAVVSEIAQKMKESESTVVVEYRGLSVAEMTELRRNLREEGVEFKVYKNSLAQRAAVEAGAEELSKDLIGPNAIAFGGDAVAPARVLAKFAKSHENLVLKSGIVEGKVVGVDTIKELSSLPNREGMLSMLLSCLQSPVRSFACAVKAVADAKEEGSAEAAPQE